MTRRNRTAKTLGTRHDLNYFTAWTLSRRWGVGLSIGIPAAMLLWLCVFSLRGSAAPYSKGELSSAHAVFGARCETCHGGLQADLQSKDVQSGGHRVGFRKHVSDAACLACHAAPVHQASMEFAPSCSSCHQEHRGSMVRLARVGDSTCTQCHADLQSVSGANKFESHIDGFGEGFAAPHPEFAPLREGYKNTTTIIFSHTLHLREHLAGPAGSTVQLVCQDCHRVPAQAGSVWPYGGPEFRRPTLQASGFAAGHDKSQFAYMTPVSYQKACVICHALQFDARFKETAPHDKLEVVQQFLGDRFRQYIAKNPAEVHAAQPAPFQIAETQAAPAPRNAEEWVNLRVQQSEQLLWRQSCLLCHQADSNAAGVPRVKPSNIPARWFPNSVFNHESHQALACESCHTAVKASMLTADKLLPSIKTCESCHTGKPTKIGVAENGCFLCHAYHKWNTPHEWRGKYAIKDLVTELR